MFDVAIIGGGVIGAMCARELLKYKLNLCILEKHSQVGNETSKANSAIVHAGYDCPVNSNKAKFNPKGNMMMEEVCEDLGVEFKRTGSFVVAFTDSEVETLKEILERGKQNGVPEIEIISGEKARELEPNLSVEVKAALYSKTAGIVASYTLTRKVCQNAIQNGAILKTNCEVLKIQKQGDFFVITTPNEEIEAKYVINAAGVSSDLVAKMAGDDSFTITPRKGEYLLFDKKYGDTVKHVIFQTPSKFGKGILVAPTTGGPLLIGPNAHNIEDKKDTTTSKEGFEEIIEGAKRSVQNLNIRESITSFAGLRAISSTDDFIISESKNVKNLIHAAGIQSPGLSSAPAIAVYIAKLIYELNGGFEINTEFNPKLKVMPHILNITTKELEALIKENPEYGSVICRCETVTKAEIMNAIDNGANDLDSIKQETRAGMGRCQGGFCMPRVLEILAKHLNVPFTEITKKGEGSYILTTETKKVQFNEGGNIL